ncbi:MAG: glycoside hydrolase family 127 protein [Ruminococcaceae bacterium]|nr:glycoside hydrolase family 127 protein [Oscillospiraceae bacterium]
MIKHFKLTSGLLCREADLVCREIIPYQEKILEDAVPGAARSHAIDNFRNAAYLNRHKEKAKGGEFYGQVFQDSDVAKWIESAAYSLLIKPDKALEKRIDALCDIIAEAQEEDGYLDTYFTLVRPTEKFKNLLEGHELYCAGHMIEAAVALYEATGSRKLLNVAEKNADLIHRHFITDGAEGYPGHPEIELALMRLYRITGNEKHKEAAEHFINTRGIDPDFYVKEAKNRDWKIWGNNPNNREYQQSHLPVREQEVAKGHAVRALYLYTAMADIAIATKESRLSQACFKLFDNIVNRQMYITGGIGTTKTGEAFSTDYDLPNDTAYCETCASVALVFFASRLLKLKRSGLFADVMERAVFNTILAGIELDGKKFFYVNPSEIIPGVSGVIVTHIHDLPERFKWHSCACCPPNAARLFTSIAKYAWDIEDGVLYSNIFAGGELTLSDVSIDVETAYPFGNTVKYTVKSGGTRLGIHIPRFALSSYRVSAAGEFKDGYYYVDVKAGDVITLSFDMIPCVNRCNRKVASNSGKAAITVGPIVYCAEGADNDGEVFSFTLNGSAELKLDLVTPAKIGGFSDAANDLGQIYTVTATGTELVCDDPDALYFTDGYREKKKQIKLIPYFMWGNRGLGQMRVWLPVK